MLKSNSSFLRGVFGGIPIMLGYISVSFAFGIYCIGCGLDIWQAVIISAANLTSAGQLAGVGVIAAGGSFIEIASTQLVINFRYALMSISLSQKADDTIRLADRFWISFFITDEVFAVASSSQKSVGRIYMLGLTIPPLVGWVLGTLLGALLGNILPVSVVSALGIAIYGMFIAIIIPPAKKYHSVAGVIIAAMVLSSMFKYVPLLFAVSSGFSIIICAVVSAAAFAVFKPINNEENSEEEI